MQITRKLHTIIQTYFSKKVPLVQKNTTMQNRESCIYCRVSTTCCLYITRIESTEWYTLTVITKHLSKIT